MPTRNALAGIPRRGALMANPRKGSGDGVAPRTMIDDDEEALREGA
jgi:hypothetical protein